MKTTKSSYGLKQTRRQCSEKIDTSFCHEFKFHNRSYDPSVCFKQNDGKFILVSLYVDGFLFATNSRDAVQKIEAQLRSNLDIFDFGEVEVCLRLGNHCEIASHELKLSQKAYFFKLLERVSILNSRPCKTPIDEQISHVHLGDKEFFSTSYQRGVSSLMH